MWFLTRETCREHDRKLVENLSNKDMACYFADEFYVPLLMWFFIGARKPLKEGRQLAGQGVWKGKV